jgi:putative cell wall-binding protein
MERALLPGRTRLLPGLARLGLVIAVVAGGLGLPQPAAADHDYVIDLTFPVAGPVEYRDGFYASRGARGDHRARDLFGQRLQRVYAAKGGEICYRSPSDGGLGGYGLGICADDGRRYIYLHLNNDTPGTDDGKAGPGYAYAPGMKEGVEVERGQWIGWMGDSGNAEGEGPQLHFHIQDSHVDPDEADRKLHRIAPTNSLRAAQERGDVPAPTKPDAVTRLSGPTRLETAVAISQRVRDSAETVVIAPSYSPQEALVAAPLAARRDGPVLLSQPNKLAATVQSEVARLGATRAVLVGRKDQLGEEVEEGLREAGVVQQERIAAENVFALSVKVAKQLYPLTADADLQRQSATATGAPESYTAGPGPPAPERVLLARGAADVPSRAWPDALSASGLAAHLDAPILLTRQGELSEEVADYLDEAAPDALDVIGGRGAVSEDVAATAAESGDAEQRRLGGATRYGTSQAVAVAGLSAGLKAQTLWTATGRDYPDALAAGPAAASGSSPTLLIDGERFGGAAPTRVLVAATAEPSEEILVTGGDDVLTDGVTGHTSRLASD